MATAFRTVPLLAALLIPPAPARAAVDVATSAWTVAADGTAVFEGTFTIRLPDDKSPGIQRIPLTWSPSVETLRVIDAHIEKPDGRVLSAGREAIAEAPPPTDPYARVFLDQRRLLVSFIDAGPGDVVEIRTRREMFRSRVPGGFAIAPVLARNGRNAETNFSVSVPSAMPFQFEVRGFSHDTETIQDRTVHYFRLQKDAVLEPDVIALNPFDRAPRLAVSTFADWDAFARAFGLVLLPHTAIAPEVQAKANQIVSGRTDAAARARAIYEWVRDTIHFVPVPLTEGRPDPHDAALVLKNGYGDSKDHAVLLIALLGAVGIPAEFVLLNAADTATIAGPPNLQPMNHLIVYLPGLDVYLDSSSGSAPFGALPFSELGKPALHIGGPPPALRTIPLPADNRAEMRTEAALSEDGEVVGTTVTTARGAFAVWLRSAAGTIARAGGTKAAEGILRQRGETGTGDFAPPARSEAAEYSLNGSFRLTGQTVPLDGGFFKPWTGPRILPRPGDFLAGPLAMRGLAASEPVFCYPGQQREILRLTLPEGRKVSSPPADIDAKAEFAHFHAHWDIEGRVVTVTRDFETTVPGPVCDAQTRAELEPVLDRVRAEQTNVIGLLTEP